MRQFTQLYPIYSQSAKLEIPMLYFGFYTTATVFSKLNESWHSTGKTTTKTENKTPYNHVL